ncbi:uncharacterized protein LOC124166694 [Ischnura elegans]|uniref:uncharacterized protein LOC124166694 n=1 Tax=Ischnura elegans TaxID=197161 RepID=UPI001ED88ECD|nr:uncharacterized protein LOC124166694 [Ischnura elegans]
MARNYEKNFGQLNRWWLSQNTPVGKQQRRPRLADLNTVEEIRKWLPSVKEEINFCLMQSQVPCYTDRKVTEYHKQVLKLEVEYKRMLKKAKCLDSKAVLCDRTVRPYKKTRMENKGEPSKSVIVLPVLDLSENQPESPIAEEEIRESASPNSDLPLKFEPITSHVNVVESNKKPEVNILGLSYSSSDDET